MIREILEESSPDLARAKFYLSRAEGSLLRFRDHEQSDRALEDLGAHYAGQPLEDGEAPTVPAEVPPGSVAHKNSERESGGE